MITNINSHVNLYDWQAISLYGSFSGLRCITWKIDRASRADVRACLLRRSGYFSYCSKMCEIGAVGSGGLGIPRYDAVFTMKNDATHPKIGTPVFYGERERI